MSFALRRFQPLVLVFVTAVAVAPGVSADPDIDSESAAAVIQELEEQGYQVEVKGVSGENIELLTTCTVTAIHNPGEPTPDPTTPGPTTTTTVYVDVACPIQHS